MPRPLKYEEPTKVVSVRLPHSALEKLDGYGMSRGEAIVRLLGMEGAVKVPEVPQEVKTPEAPAEPDEAQRPEGLMATDRRTHRDCRMKSIAGRSRCMDHEMWLT